MKKLILMFFTCTLAAFMCVATQCMATTKIGMQCKRQASPEPPPAPPMSYDAYEQANLVAMWDCTTNLTAFGWTDTSGRYTFTWSDPTLVDIASNGVKFLDVGGYGYLGGFDTARTFGATNAIGYSTIELVFEEGTTNYQYFFESNTKKALVYTAASVDTPGFLGCIGRNIKTTTNVDMTSGRNTVTVKYFGNSYKNPTNILINAHVGVASKITTSVTASPFEGTYLGHGSSTDSSASNMWCRSRISAIRIYSDHLTSEQIVANCEVDQNRVFPPLPSPEPQPLPPPPVSTDWISNVGFDGTDSKWGTLLTGASFAENQLVLRSVVTAVTYPGLMPVDVLKTNLVVDTTVRFKPYRTLPAVRDTAKCGVIARFDGTVTNYWVLAKKSDAEANEWVDSGRAADATAATAVRMTLVTASRETTVEYRVGEAAEPIVKTVYVPSTAVRVTFMGSGEVATLKGWTSDSSEIKTVPSVDIGGGTLVPVVVESVFLKANGLENASADEVSAALSKTRTDGNRMKLIDSYVLGLDPNVETSVPIVVSPQNADAGLVTLTLANVEVRVDAGAVAVFRPLASDTPTGVMTPVDGLEESPLPIFEVGVPDGRSPVKYYKIGYRLVAQTKGSAWKLPSPETSERRPLSVSGVPDFTTISGGDDCPYAEEPGTMVLIE